MCVGGPPRESVHHWSGASEPIDRGSQLASARLNGECARANAAFDLRERRNESDLTPRRVQPRPARPRTGTCARWNHSPTSSPGLRHNRNRRRGGTNRIRLSRLRLPRGRKAAAEVGEPRPHRFRQECSAQSETRGTPLVPTQWRSGTRASLQKFDGAMAAWLAERGYTKIKALNYDQLLKTTLLSRDEAVHAALRCRAVRSLRGASPFSRGALRLARREDPACSITISRDESVRSAGDGERLKCCGE